MDPLPTSQESRLRPTGKQLRALALIIIVGTLLRAVPILWGTTFWNPVQYNFHADEPKIVRQVDDFPTYLTEYHDYRYPHFLHMAYGVTWWAVGDALKLRDDKVSMPGVPGYERTLVFTRSLNVLIFGLGAMLLLWLFGKRMFGPGAALFVVAASSIQGWVVASTSLVQTDVPSAYALFALFYVLLKYDRAEGLRPRQGWLLGIIMGMAIAMKYTSAIGWIAILISAVAGIRRQAMTVGQGTGFLILAGLGCILSFLAFVPGAAYDFSNFYLSIKWEFLNKMEHAEFSLSDFLESLFTCLPLWIMLPALAGLALCLVRERSLTVVSMVICMGLYVAISARAFRPDYAISLMPFAAVFSGYAAWKVSTLKTAGMPIAVIYLIAGHVFVGYTVSQRYLGDTRYTAEAWIMENIEPGPLGDGPNAIGGRSMAPECPPGYEFVKVYGKPEWLVLCERHYEPCLNTIEDPNFYAKAGYPVKDPNNRELGLLKEVDFLFYEDVMLEKRREYKYDLIKKIPKSNLPLDLQGEDVLIYRRSDAE
ncbi:MAG: glycosyltransferase family 39 protein [Planctomycetota bacterium]|nr:glycosyltransferase family 39 protein [Planctomycetota bacterium]